MLRVHRDVSGEERRATTLGREWFAARHFLHRRVISLFSACRYCRLNNIKRITEGADRGVGVSPLPPLTSPPPPAPLSPSSLLGAARASHTQNFPLSPPSPFFKSPLSLPLFSLLPPLFSLLPPLTPPSRPSSPPPSYPVRPLITGWKTF